MLKYCLGKTIVDITCNAKNWGTMTHGTLFGVKVMLAASQVWPNI